MTDSERERIIRIEAILPAIQNSMNKIMESQEAITVLKLSAEEHKIFIKNFEKEVVRIVKNELNTSMFHEEIDEQIDKRVEIIFNQQKTRTDFNDKVSEIIDEKLDKATSKLFKKIVIYIAIATGTVILSVLKGVIGV